MINKPNGLFWFYFLAVVLTAAMPSITSSAEVGCDAAKTTVEMEGCFESRLKKAEDSLSALKKRLQIQLKDHEREALNKADVSWLEYREANCKSASILYRGGTMEGLVFISCKAQMTEERIKDLNLTYGERLRGSGS